jgi:Fe-S cluster assembly iron-binding protein IscA
MESYARLKQIIEELKKELTISQKKCADFAIKLAQAEIGQGHKDLEIAQLQKVIADLKEQIFLTERRLDYFRDQANINLAENRYLWDRLRNNPYPDEKYNDD